MMNDLNLCGIWKLRWSDGVRGKQEFANREQVDAARYIEACVPGEVHLDLWKAGLIEDPYVGLNCLSARWVEDCVWSYRREFEAPEGVGTSRSWLVFEGLDLAAVMVLNGREVGRHCNSFHPCRLEVTGHLRPGKNILAVHLEGGLFHVADKKGAGYNHAPDQALHKRHWLRKPQCQFGWDWSTRLINVGIFKPVRLEWTAHSVVQLQFSAHTETAADLGSGRVTARLFVEGLSQQAVKGDLLVRLVEAGLSVSRPVTIQPGAQCLEGILEIKNPALWWPVGRGPQTLHTVKATLVVDGVEMGAGEARVGFRHVRVNQDPHPREGRYFHLEVNGEKVFAKGANFVPADMIFARLDRARYHKLVDLALEANFNLLRVWGGGLYENDDFYRLCDEKGLLVWQEFIFACSKYPVNDEAFYNSIRLEAQYNIRRLAEHPSLVVWCGNNEMEQGVWHWGYDKGEVFPDYSFFHHTLPRLLAQEDPTRFYQPSSPFSPDHLDPLRDDVGDQHPWSIGFANTDFREYRKMTCRFPNEGGVLGPVSLPTMQACLPEKHRFVGSFAWQTHDNSVDSWWEPSCPDEMIRQWLGLDVRSLSIEDFTYWGGLLQGEALKEYCENFRRRMFDSGSAIFWMYNDCWPATRSWTIVDYYLRRTPSFSPVRRAMAPVHVVLAVEGEDVVVFGVNDTRESIQADLQYGLFHLAGGYPLDLTAGVTLAPNASTCLATFPLSKWSRTDSTVAFAVLRRQGGLLARNRLLLPLFKDLAWSPANIVVSRVGDKAIFSCDVFAWGLCLDLQGERPLADNFFDVYPGQSYEIPWCGEQLPVILKTGNSIKG
ncbi:MAG: sugar-binding domain-containing protein [Lentisphaerota bacterium]